MVIVSNNGHCHQRCIFLIHLRLGLERQRISKSVTEAQESGQDTVTLSWYIV